MQELASFTDDQLLLELRRRGRLARLDHTASIDGYALLQGMSMEYAMHSVFREIGEELFRKIGPDPTGTVPGFTVTKDCSGDKFAPTKIHLPLNFVVEKKGA